MNIGDILAQAGTGLGSSAIDKVIAKGDGSGEGIANNKVGAVLGGVGACAALATLGITVTPVVGVALCAGALAGAKGESTTKKAVGFVGSAAVGTAKLTGGALAITAYGLAGGVSSILRKFKSDQLHLKEGITFFEQQDYPKALASFNLAEAKSKNNPDIYLIRAVTFEKLSQLNEAIQDYSKVIELNPDFTEAYSRRGTLHLEFSKDYDKAVGDFTKFIQSNNADISAYLSRAKAYVALEEYIDAITDYDKVISLQPDQSEACFLRGCLLVQIGDYKSAISDFNQFINLNPKLFAGYYQRANALINIGDYKDAIKDFSFLIKNYPHESSISDIYLQRAICYQQLSASKAAISDYNEVISRIPDCLQAYFQRGILHSKSGDLRRGENDLRQVVELNPKHVDAYVKLGYISTAKNNYKYAISFFKTAIKLLYEQSRLTEIPPLQNKN